MVAQKQPFARTPIEDRRPGLPFPFGNSLTNSHRHTSEDWVQQTSGLTIRTPGSVDGESGIGICPNYEVCPCVVFCQSIILSCLLTYLESLPRPLWSQNRTFIPYALHFRIQMDPQITLLRWTMLNKPLNRWNKYLLPVLLTSPCGHFPLFHLLLASSRQHRIPLFTIKDSRVHRVHCPIRVCRYPIRQSHSSVLR